MRLDGYLQARGSMRVQRPPLLWEADTDEVPLVRLLDEMIAIGLLRGSEPADLTLNVANVTVKPSEDDEGGEPDEWLPAGDYVAVTVRGRGHWSPETVWRPGAPLAEGVIAKLADRLRDARARFAYTRDLGREGCVTVYLSRSLQD